MDLDFQSQDLTLLIKSKFWSTNFEPKLIGNKYLLKSQGSQLFFKSISLSPVFNINRVKTYWINKQGISSLQFIQLYMDMFIVGVQSQTQPEKQQNQFNFFLSSYWICNGEFVQGNQFCVSSLFDKSAASSG